MQIFTHAYSFEVPSRHWNFILFHFTLLLKVAIFVFFILSSAAFWKINWFFHPFAFFILMWWGQLINFFILLIPSFFTTLKMARLVLGAELQKIRKRAGPFFYVSQCMATAIARCCIVAFERFMAAFCLFVLPRSIKCGYKIYIRVYIASAFPLRIARQQCVFILFLKFKFIFLTHIKKKKKSSFHTFDFFEIIICFHPLYSCFWS